MDNQLKMVGASESGTTCSLVFVRTENDKSICYIANLGDTRAVLNEDNIAKRMTVDHKATNEAEIKRIKNAGGLIIRNRVSGQLAVTRALGDLDLKTEGVICVPDVNQFEITDKTK